VTRPRWRYEAAKPAIVKLAESFQGATDVDRLAIFLMTAWGNADPARNAVSEHPVSFVATFADMARALLDADAGELAAVGLAHRPQ
jgi:hypothetical protein